MVARSLRHAARCARRLPFAVAAPAALAAPAVLAAPVVAAAPLVLAGPLLVGGALLMTVPCAVAGPIVAARLARRACHRLRACRNEAAGTVSDDEAHPGQ